MPIVRVAAILVVSVLARPAPAGPLAEVCPVDWRGEPWGKALPELARRLGATYILDASVDAAAKDVPVRFCAWHLTGEEAMRWLARSAGLEAVPIQEVFLIARAERLPGVWRVAGRVRGGAGGPEDDPRWRAAQPRRVDVKWIDSPVSRVAADVAAGFGVDLVLDPAIVRDQPLVQLEKAGASLEDVRRGLAEQIGVHTVFVDGALWGRSQAAGGPRATATGLAAPDRLAGPGRPLSRWVVLDGSIPDWSGLAARLSQAPDGPCEVEAAPGVSGPGIDAAGSVGEILEAGRLLGRWSWSLGPGDGQGSRRFLLRVHGREKSP